MVVIQGVQSVKRLLLVVTGWLCMVHYPSTAQSPLDYQERPYAFEGVKRRPVSGFDIELLSVMADASEKAIEIGDRMRLRFYLDRHRPAHLVVREIEQHVYYWLDRAKPPGDWTIGYNTFSWPTTVVRQLPGLKPADLGVVIRLDREEPGAQESVAAASWLAPGEQGATARSYAFVFKLREDAQLKATIFDEPAGKPVIDEDLGSQRGGRPFLFRWDVAKTQAAPGRYRLVIKGYLLTNNDPVSQVVLFVHPLGGSK